MPYLTPPMPTWVEIAPGHHRALRGPIAVDVEQYRRSEDRWTWIVGITSRDGMAVEFMRSGPKLTDLLPLARAQAEAWDAAGEYGAAIVEGREVRRG